MKTIHVDNEDALKEYNELVMIVPTIVLFYSPMCGHCMSMKDEWESFENYAKDLEGKGMIARVRNDYIGEVNGDSDIMGYPTILSLRNGSKISEFDDERLRDKFIEYLESQNPDLKKNQKGGKRRLKKSRKTKKRVKSKKQNKFRRTRKYKKSVKSKKSRKSRK